MDVERINRLLAEGRITAAQVAKAAAVGIVPAQAAQGSDVPALTANLDALRAKAVQVRAANQADMAQDDTIITQANALSGTAGARTLAQLSGDVRSLAQGLATLAQNDQVSKRELQMLANLVLKQFSDTSGT